MKLDYKFFVPLTVSCISLAISSFMAFQNWNAKRENLTITQIALGELSFDFGIKLDQEYLVANTSDRTITVSKSSCYMFVKLPDEEYGTQCSFGDENTFPLKIAPGEAVVVNAEIPFSSSEAVGRLTYKLKEVKPDARPSDLFGYLNKVYGLDYAGNRVLENERELSGDDEIVLNDDGNPMWEGAGYSIGTAATIRQPIKYYHLFDITLTTIRGQNFKSDKFISRLGILPGF
jgi:hypothetical protein